MKKYMISLLLLFCFTAHAQTVKISGKIMRWKAGAPSHLTNMAQVDIPVKVDADGGFAVTIPQLKKGVYVLQGIGNVYLEPGYAINIGIDKDSNYIFKGKGSVENNLMAGTKKMLGQYFPGGKDGFFFETYMMGVDTFLQKMDAYKVKANLLRAQSPSVYFKTISKKDFDFYCLNLTSNYMLYYGVDSIKQENFYKMMDSRMGKGGTVSTDSVMKANKEMHVKVMTPQQRKLLDSLCYVKSAMNDSVMLVNSGEYRKFMSSMIMHLVYTDFMKDFIARADQSVIKLKVVKKFIGNGYMRDYYTSTFTGDIIKMSKDSALKDSVYHDFMVHVTNPVFRTEISRVYDNYITFGNNKMAPDFMYASVDGEKVSLKSLRGKYVYIDVWATWCVPCKREIPYLAEVEEAYKERNIHFVSLSVDVQADKEEWQQYVKKNQLKGFQLIADDAFNSDFIKKFNINSIPRFILVGPDGKIISANAKRPSDPELKMELDELLKKVI